MGVGEGMGKQLDAQDKSQKLKQLQQASPLYCWTCYFSQKTRFYHKDMTSSLTMPGSGYTVPWTSDVILQVNWMFHGHHWVFIPVKDQSWFVNLSTFWHAHIPSGLLDNPDDAVHPLRPSPPEVILPILFDHRIFHSLAPTINVPGFWWQRKRQKGMHIIVLFWMKTLSVETTFKNCIWQFSCFTALHSATTSKSLTSIIQKWSTEVSHILHQDIYFNCYEILFIIVQIAHFPGDILLVPKCVWQMPVPKPTPNTSRIAD